MTRIVGALAMGMLFLMISGDLRAKLMDSLAGAAEALDKAGIFAYVGLAVVLIGGMLIVLTSGPETQNRQHRPLVIKKSRRERRNEEKEKVVI